MSDIKYRSEMSLAEAYPCEQQRLRELLEDYKAIGPAGAFGYAAISAVLNRANVAAENHDTVSMLKCYAEMKECC